MKVYYLSEEFVWNGFYITATKNFEKIISKASQGRLLRLPAIAITLFGLLCISTVTGLAFIPAMKMFMWIPIVLELICCIVLYFYTENYQVKVSYEKLEDYKTYCEDIYRWLQSCSLSTREEIQEIRRRLLAHIEKVEADRKYKKESTDRWLQVLVIPVILAVLSAFINQQTGYVQAMNYAFFLIFIFLVIYSMIWGVRRVRYFFSGSNLEQIQCFANDLQGVLDTQFKTGAEESKNG